MNTNSIYNVYEAPRLNSLTDLPSYPIVAMNLDMIDNSELLEMFLNTNYLVIEQGSDADQAISDINEKEMSAYLALPLKIRLGL